MHDKFFVDFYLPQQDIIIEVFGDYWHGNSKIYGDEEGLIPFNEKQIKQRKKDKSRIAYLKTCHNQVIVLWEYDIKNNLGECQELIKNIINQNP
jgi:very-short-patch-repair endonuclease